MTFHSYYSVLINLKLQPLYLGQGALQNVKGVSKKNPNIYAENIWPDLHDV